MTITIVGLGPGSADQMTREAWAAVANATRVLLWPADQTLVGALPEGPVYQPVLSDNPDIEGIDAQPAQVAQAVVEAAQAEDVVFAVPGSPYVLNETVQRVQVLSAERGIPCQIINGISVIPSVLAALGVRDSGNLQVVSAYHLMDKYHPPFSPDSPAVVVMHDAPAAGARVKQVLLNQYPPSHPVQIVHRPGTPAEQVDLCMLQALDPANLAHWATTLFVPTADLLGSFASLQDTMAHLRAPEGCPWDREQDHLTLRPYLLEETYEVLDALDRGDLQALEEELGDLLLQVAFHVQVAVDAGEFHMTDVINHINTKLIHRHPHVWGQVDVNDSDDVARNWEAIKKQERRDNGKARDSLLDGVSKALPSLAQAYNYQVRAARVGFDWERIEPVLDKIREEIDEIQAAEDPAHQAREIGDLLFALVNWTRWMDVEPETALREANQRFYQRFHFIEQRADEAGRLLSDMTLDEMDALWDEAKAQGL